MNNIDKHAVNFVEISDDSLGEMLIECGIDYDTFIESLNADHDGIVNGVNELLAKAGVVTRIAKADVADNQTIFTFA
jgi:Tfp pilus assembly PilM family ATPase